jgi:tetratricopeptide (TPR) repeat protein
LPRRFAPRNDQSEGTPRLLKYFILIAALTINCGAVFGGAGDELKEKNRVISEYYRLAMESFYGGEYTSAIARWTEILKVDPEQAQAARLIEAAREKMSERIKPLSGEVVRLVSKGSYAKALEKNKELLALDPVNKRWLALSAKLEKISAIIPEETKPGKVQGLMRKSINTYLSGKDDPRFSVNASRYAWQLNEQYKAAAELKEFMETEYSDVARNERIVSGMNIIEQKLQAALTYIYDGKYDKTILECNDVLELEPKNILALKRAGSAYYASGNKKKAKESWQQASQISPDDVELIKFMKMK